MDLDHPDNKARYARLIERVREPAGRPWEKDGDQVREYLRLAWELWVMDPDPATPAQREFLVRCLGLLTREVVGRQSESLDLTASFLVHMPAGIAEDLKNTLKGASSLMLDQQAPTAAARKLMAKAAEREADFGFGHALYFALAGLPHSLGLLAKRMPTATTGKPDLTERYQRILLTCQDIDCVESAFRLLYLGPGTQWSIASLKALEAASAPSAAWLGVGQAALERPLLQAPLTAHLLEHPHPELMPAVAWIWVYGAPSAQSAAERLLLREGSTAELPLVEQHVPASPSVVAACQSRPGARSALQTEVEPPWTASERLFASGLLWGAPVIESALAALRALGQKPSVARVDLLLELVEGLAPRLIEDPIFNVFVDHCAQAQSRRLLEGLTVALVRAVGNGQRVSGEKRELLAKLAPGVVEGQDSSLGLARLGLPHNLAYWREQRQKLLPATRVHEEDQALAFALLPEEPQPLQVVYEDATPNQRRLLLARAPLSRFPAAAPALLSWLSHEDPASLPVFLERLIEEKPDNLIAILSSLTGQEMPEPVRKAAVQALGERGGRTELILLGSLVGVDTALARAAILERLSAEGRELGGGGLEIAAAGGELVAAEGGAAPPPPSSPTAPKDPRRRLVPPPRPLSLPLLLSYLVLAPNGWGLIWSNLILAVTVFSYYAREPEIPHVVGGILPFLFNHWLCRTDQELRCLRQGVVLAATVEVETRRTRGKNPTTQWYHRLRLLADDGRLHHHTLVQNARSDALLDEKHELVLTVLDPNGAPGALRALDTLRLVEVDSRGFFRLRRRSWALLLVATLPSWPILYDYLT